MDLNGTFLIGLLLRAPVVLFSLTIHEFMHGWVAYKCGDDTAYRAGRLTLNPVAHLDLLGTICLFFAPIGWAKPVPVNPYNYRNPRRDDILVSGAGVAANLALAVVLAFVIRGLVTMNLLPTSQMQVYVWIMLCNAVIMNFGLFFFNLLPVPPLDGSHILRELLPARASAHIAQIGRYGIFILLGLVLVNNRIHFPLLGYEVSLLQAPVLLLTWLFAGPSATEMIF